MEKRSTITDNDGKIVLTIPRQTNGFAVILTGLWTIGYIVILVTIVYGQISDSRFVAGLNLTIFFFGTVCFICLKMFLWNIQGKERITLDSKELRIQRLGTFLTFPKKYETQLIDGFEVTTKPNGVSFSSTYGFSDGRVAFDYWGQTKRFGQTITTKQAEQIVDQLNAKIRNYAQQKL